MSNLRLAGGLLVGVLLTAIVSPVSAQQGPLVDAEWLSKNLENPKVRVFEVSVDPGVYEHGHVPGAVNISWHTDLVDPVKRDIVSPAKFEELLEKAGVTKDTTIVLYGDNNNWFAAWGAWVFNQYGLGDQVKLLDGGRKLWEKQALPLDTKAPSYAKSDLTLLPAKPELRARLANVLEVVEAKKDAVIVDIRSGDEFSGKLFAPEGSKELSIRAGHVPGAKNVPWSKAVDAETGKFRSKEELKKLYADAGVDGSKPIIVYCRIGERSSHTWYVLSRILGYDVRNYDGSWTEYGNSVGVPVVNLAGTVWQGK
ncbi:thiosulfate/3-mercaptopyruvate sulfurtransferase [Angulomicrobium tetraedrale]|uniref:Sulfurtransferase n=1 Tax=Ancylobacter tetraedralis TaxID=217068 RepID=A0A839YZS3_9HYPH|nr:sulfurtransferase [Ancylobacter tetraedralis]MBB3770014.1 thiosulfate/3-mercaptopyruvate sulfurtransferase [Ancylobacter tetraedralis]